MDACENIANGLDYKPSRPKALNRLQLDYGPVLVVEM